MARVAPSQHDTDEARIVLEACNEVILAAENREILYCARASQYTNPILRITEDFSRTWKERKTALTLLAVETQANAKEAEKDKKRREAALGKAAAKRARVAAEHGTPQARYDSGDLLPSHARGIAATARAEAEGRSPPHQPSPSPEAAFGDTDATLSQLKKLAKKDE